MARIDTPETYGQNRYSRDSKLFNIIEVIFSSSSHKQTLERPL